MVLDVRANLGHPSHHRRCAPGGEILPGVLFSRLHQSRSLAAAGMIVMATAYVTLGPGSAYNVFHGENVRSEAVSTSGTAASGALTAAAGDIAQVFCATAVYARSGNTVTVATGCYCPAGIPTFIRMTPGDAVSLIDV